MMKKVILVLLIITMLISMLVIPTFAYDEHEMVTFNGGIGFTNWAGTYDTRRYRIVYTNVEGTIYSGDSIQYTASGTTPTQNAFPFPTFVGYSNNTLLPLQTSSLDYGVVDSDRNEIDYDTNLVVSRTDVGCVRVRYRFGNDVQSMFVGTIGGFASDPCEPMQIFVQNNSYSAYTQIRIRGTYYIFDYTADEENGRDKYVRVEINKTLMGYNPDNSTYYDYIALDPTSAGVFDTYDIDWIFTGNIACASQNGVSYVTDYAVNLPRYIYSGYQSYSNGEKVFGFNPDDGKVFCSMGARFVDTLFNGGAEPPMDAEILEINTNGYYDVRAYDGVEVDVPQTIAESMFGWLFESATAVLAFEVAPGYSIGGIMTLVVGMSLIVWLLKVFLGG